ncbi:MAG: FAD:protein FMN transferase [Pirellulaceae bacterium]
MKRFPQIGLLLVLLFLPTALLHAQDGIVGWTGTTMGPIEYQIKVVAPESTAVDSLKKEIEIVFDLLNRQMSTYLPDSEISRFNNSSTTDWFTVSPATAKVVSRALEVSVKTQGAFDITVKPVVERWNFGANKGEFQMPTPEETQSLLARVGFEKLAVRLEPPAIRKTIPDLQVDLSAIAKGYAVDLASIRLAELSFQNHFVEIGGEVRAAGKKPDGSKWRVGIEKPLEGVRDVERIVELSDVSMATSGDYRNFRMIGNQRYSHTIDPKTARPVENQMASASVIAADCMSADAFATSAMVMGPKAIGELAKSENLGIYILEREGESCRSSQFGEIPFADAEPVSQQGEGSPVFILIVSFAVFAIAILAMAVGAIFSQRTIKGSCGGISATTGADGSSNCSVCQNPVSDCTEKNPAGSTSR